MEEKKIVYPISRRTFLKGMTGGPLVIAVGGLISSYASEKPDLVAVVSAINKAAPLETVYTYQTSFNGKKISIESPKDIRKGGLGIRIRTLEDNRLDCVYKGRKGGHREVHAGRKEDCDAVFNSLQAKLNAAYDELIEQNKEYRVTKPSPRNSEIERIALYGIRSERDKWIYNQLIYMTFHKIGSLHGVTPRPSGK